MSRTCAIQNWRIFLILLFLSTVVVGTDCCSSRVIFMQDTELRKKMQSQEISRNLANCTPSKRNFDNEDDIRLIHMILSRECSNLFNLYYCLNGGRCFNYTIGNLSTPSCECSEGYFGERCESKYFLTSDLYTRKISMAKIYIGSFLAGFLGSALIYGCCIAFLNSNTEFHFSFSFSIYASRQLETSK